MEERTREHRDYGFISGLLAGTFIGAGLVVWLLPQSRSELRHRISDSARTLGQGASDQYHKATARAGEALDEITRKGQGVRDSVADAVERGAQEVGRYAKAARTGRAADDRKERAADQPATDSRPL